MGNHKITIAKPFILMMYGFPGVGKSAFAKQLAEELGVIHLQEDRVRVDLFGENNSPGAYKGAKKVVNYIAQTFLKNGMSVVYDSSSMRASERKKVRELAHANKAHAVLVWLQTDPETAFDKAAKRDRRRSEEKYSADYDEQTYREILSYMQNPEMNENYIVVSGKHTFSSQRSAVIKRFYEIGVISADDMASNVVKPGLTNLVPKPVIHTRGDMIRRNISIGS